MSGRVSKWGNSLALRIPKSFAAEIGHGENSSIQIMIKEGALVVTPEREPKWCLEELLEKVTKENIWICSLPSQTIAEVLAKSPISLI